MSRRKSEESDVVGIYTPQEASEGRRIAEAALQQASANASRAAEGLYVRLGEEHRQELEKVRCMIRMRSQHHIGNMWQYVAYRQYHIANMCMLHVNQAELKLSL
jgi:hypothetical protein